MSTDDCFICSKRGPVQKLFKKCEHELACNSCLRKLYVEEAQTSVLKYPLQCFHPDCNRILRETQVLPLCLTGEETYNHFQFSEMAKKKKGMLGSNWKELIVELQCIRNALGFEAFCRCPKCHMVITKDGGCDHMCCISCHHDFSWTEVTESCDYFAVRPAVSYRHYLLRNHASTMKPKPPDLKFYTDFDYQDASEYDYDEETTFLSEINSSNEGETNDNDDDEEGNFSTSLSRDDSLNAVDDEDTVSEDYELVSILSQNEEATSSDHSTTTSNTWEELSEVSSVISLNTTGTPSTDSSVHGLSYLEAAKLSDDKGLATDMATTSTTKRQNLTSRSAKESMYTIVEEDSDEDIDAFYMCDLSKSSRGGKQKYMFNRQPKSKGKYICIQLRYMCDLSKYMFDLSKSSRGGKQKYMFNRQPKSEGKYRCIRWHHQKRAEYGRCEQRSRAAKAARLCEYW